MKSPEDHQKISMKKLFLLIGILATLQSCVMRSAAVHTRPFPSSNGWHELERQVTMKHDLPIIKSRKAPLDGSAAAPVDTMIPTVPNPRSVIRKGTKVTLARVDETADYRYTLFPFFFDFQPERKIYSVWIIPEDEAEKRISYEYIWGSNGILHPAPWESGVPPVRTKKEFEKSLSK